MRAAFWGLLLIVIVLGLALAIRFDAGYVLIVSPPWRIELSLPLAVGALLLLFLAAYFSVRLLRRALLLPADMRAWRGQRRKTQAKVELERAIAALLGGQDSHARKLADKALLHEGSPLGALVAAHAALRVGDRTAARALLDRVNSEMGEFVAARQHLERALAGGVEREAVPAPAASTDNG
jgi:HemY protein